MTGSLIKWVTLLLLLVGCRDPYKPDLLSADVSYLVVEGVMSAGGRPTVIRISRTFLLDDTARLRPETGALVQVESEDGLKQNLFMQLPGEYRSEALLMDISKRYRLLINTVDGSHFESDYVEVKTAPPIDSIGWARTVDGVQIYVNAFDPGGSTQYYMWDFGETYEIHSNYYSYYVFDEDDQYVRPRQMPEEEVFYCWKYDSSHSILINSSARLQEDRIEQGPIEFIFNGDERLAVRYSILLRQYAISKEAYAYLDIMRMNTEELGSVFGPMPAETRGNIRCVERPNEQVIGFAMASTATERRQFISKDELGGWDFRMNCPVDTVPADEARDRFSGGGLIPYDAIIGLLGNPVSWLASYPFCVDCTRRRGRLEKPSYW
jgi:hypothetical protein